jgi:hypothetical protein
VKSWLAPLAIAAGAALLFTARSTYDPDLFWHLAQGREVLAGHLVHANLFSATAAAYAQPYTSWAFEAMLAASARAGGLAGVQWLQDLLIASAFLMLYVSARVRHSATAAMAALLLSLLVLEPRAMPRPYLVSCIGLSLCAYAIERWRMGGRAVFVIAVVAVWANFHSEAVFGVALIGLFGVCETVAPSVLSRAAALRVVAIAALAFAATLATPYGIGMWRYLLENALVPQTLRIAELQAPTLDTYPAFFAYLLVLAVLLAVSPKRSRLWEIAVIVTFALLGLRYIRFTPMIVCAAAPILASRVDAVMQKGWDRRAVFATVAAILVVTLPASPMRMARAWRVGGDALAPPDVFSADAIAFARAHQLSGPVFNSMNLGGYLEWMMPEARVFQDSRLQAYPPGHFTAILDASESVKLWRSLVAGVDWAMVSLARPNELSGVGKFAPEEWASVFRDRSVEILVRRNGRFASAISR